MKQTKHEKKHARSENQHRRKIGLINRLLNSLFDSTVETPFDVLLSHFRVFILVFNILTISISIVLATIKMVQHDGVVIQALLGCCLILYATMIVILVIFFAQESSHKAAKRKATFWTVNKKKVLSMLKILATVLNLTTSIILVTATAPNLSGIFEILIFAYSIAMIVISSLMLTYRSYKLTRAIILHKATEQQAKTNELHLQKRRQMYVYLQHQLRELQEFFHDLDAKYEALEEKLERNFQHAKRPDDMPVLAILRDDQYPDNGIDHIRDIVRGIVVNSHGKVAILKIDGKEDIFGPRKYFELPGGGANDGETLNEAVVREIREELGLLVEPTHRLGRVDDFYNILKRENHTYYFICKVVGKGEMERTDFEKQVIDKVMWVTFEKAIKLYDNMPDKLLSRLVKNREAPVLRLAQHELDHR